MTNDEIKAIEQLAARVAELEAENELLKGRKNVELAANTDNAKSKQQREQVAAQAAVIESLKFALTGLLAYNPEQEWIGGAENGYYQTVRTCLLKEIQQAKAALSIPTDSTQILDEVRLAERQKVIDKCVALGAIERDGVFSAVIREME